MRSQKLNEAPLKSWVILSSDTVNCAHCTCFAGLGEMCTHVTALLVALEERVSVADRLAYWIGSAKQEVHLEVSEMDFTNPKRLWRKSDNAESAVSEAAHKEI